MPDIGLSRPILGAMTSLHWQTGLQTRQSHVHQDMYILLVTLVVCTDTDQTDLAQLALNNVTVGTNL